MNAALQRGIMLIGQGRADLAEREFRRALSEEPESFAAHVYLSLCLSEADRYADALAEADEGVRLEPEAPIAHDVRARALTGLKRFREAEAAAKEAIRLDPDDADYRATLGNIAIARQKPQEALDAADQALSLDANHLAARNIRALALTQLGRKDEAANTLGEALAEDPEDAFSHANKGWVCLHQNDPKAALEYFREALRLDPNLEWARVGTIEALKARYPVYRQLLQFFLWLGRQGQAAQWAVLLGIAFGPRILSSAAESFPPLKPFVAPIMVFFLGFTILTWISGPIFNFLLRFNKFGRMALSKQERLESLVIGPCACVALLFVGLYLGVERNDFFFVGMVTFGLILFPLSVTFKLDGGRTRAIAAVATIGLLCLNIPILMYSLYGKAGPFPNFKEDMTFFQYFIYGTAASSWLPAVLRTRRSFD